MHFVLYCAVVCSPPHLHTVSIKLEGSSTAGELDPTLCQLNTHSCG